MAGTKLVDLLVLCLVIAPMATEAAVSCGQISDDLAPCVNYLKGKGGSVPAKCCDGVRSINNAARTTPDRQAACKCLKSAASNISDMKPGLAEGLPGACGVHIPYKIAYSTNCNSIK